MTYTQEREIFDELKLAEYNLKIKASNALHRLVDDNATLMIKGYIPTKDKRASYSYFAISKETDRVSYYGHTGGFWHKVFPKTAAELIDLLNKFTSKGVSYVDPSDAMYDSLYEEAQRYEC